MKKKNFKEIFKKIIMLTIIISIVAGTQTAVLAAITHIRSYDAASLVNNKYYDENQPINRVFYIKTGSTSDERKLAFSQESGELSYYVAGTMKKSCMSSYKIFAYNEDTGKGTTYKWAWTKNRTIKLDKNTNYTIIVYPASFNEVCKKYLPWLSMNHDYNKSPRFTLKASVRKFSYSENDSRKIAGH